MKILITGSNGMLGTDLVNEFKSSAAVWGLGTRERPNCPIPYVQVDITARSKVRAALSTLKPDVVVHAAAWTDVDGCELNPDRAEAVNTRGTEYVAEAADAVGASLCFFSTDYVFDGTKESPYEEGDTPNPLSVYGRSKFVAEEAVKSRCRSAWIIRTSWLFGANGQNFFRSLLDLAGPPKDGSAGILGDRQTELKVVDDQKGAPTYTKDLARILGSVMTKVRDVRGCHVYHLASQGETTWFHAAEKLLAKLNRGTKLRAISSQELNRPAKRPKNSVLNMNKIQNEFGVQCLPWEEAFDAYWKESLGL